MLIMPFPPHQGWFVQDGDVLRPDCLDDLREWLGANISGRWALMAGRDSETLDVSPDIIIKTIGNVPGVRVLIAQSEAGVCSIVSASALVGFEDEADAALFRLRWR